MWPCRHKLWLIEQLDRQSYPNSLVLFAPDGALEGQAVPGTADGPNHLLSVDWTYCSDLSAERGEQRGVGQQTLMCKA